MDIYCIDKRTGRKYLLSSDIVTFHKNLKNSQGTIRLYDIIDSTGNSDLTITYEQFNKDYSTKFYTIKDNQLIIYPDTPNEQNITKEKRECIYCNYYPDPNCPSIPDFPCNNFVFKTFRTVENWIKLDKEGNVL